MIIESQKLIFIHIPKTGGTSFETYLSETYDASLTAVNLYSGEENDVLNGHSLQHSSYLEIKEFLESNHKDIDTYKIIAIVRNPYHRVLSELLCTQKIKWWFSPKRVCEITKATIEDTDPPLVRKYYSNYDNHLCSNMSFITDASHQIPANVTLVNTDNMSVVLPMLGYTGFDTYKRHHKTIRGKINYDTCFDEETREIVHQHFMDDFESGLFDPDTGKPVFACFYYNTRTKPYWNNEKKNYDSSSSK